ncbi:hypothetical protein LguiA_014163 [Lonicera macranthoides]
MLSPSNTSSFKEYSNSNSVSYELLYVGSMNTGVYTVNIDAEQQVVIVSGSVDSATLIKKLVKSGKYAELWSPTPNKDQTQMESLIDGLKAPPTQPISNPARGRQVEEDQWAFQRYLNNQHLGIEALPGETDQNFIFSNNTNMENSSMAWDDGMVLDGNEYGGVHKYHHPSMLNLQGHQYNHPSYPMMMNMHNTMGNVTMMNDNNICMPHQSQMMMNHVPIMFTPGSNYYYNHRFLPHPGN